jgi:hypothetical protein
VRQGEEVILGLGSLQQRTCVLAPCGVHSAPAAMPLAYSVDTTCAHRGRSGRAHGGGGGQHGERVGGAAAGAADEGAGGAAGC